MIKNTFTVIARKNLAFFLLSLIGFVLLYSFFYGIYTIPILQIGFFKDTVPGLFDYFYIIVASIVSSMIVTLTKYSITNKFLSRGTSFLGISSGIFATVCSVCLGVNFLVLGNFITIPLAFLIPYLFWIQLAGLTLLIGGLWLVVKSSYDKICIACMTGTKGGRSAEKSLFDINFTGWQQIAFFVLLFVALFALGIQIFPFVSGAFVSNTGYTMNTPHSDTLNLDAITSEVLPSDGYTIDATWGDSISKMVKAGVLDVDKLDSILTQRYNQPLTPEQKKLLTSDYSNDKLTINSKNAVFMMYVLWAMGKHNDNQILHDSPFAQYFTDYDIGVGKAGYGDTKLISLTEDQQAIAKFVAENSYRPCCGNPTSAPDCSHGFSALGLVELMASEGYNEDQIFDAFVKFNSYWFPATYIQDALYFKLAENKDWSSVDSELVAGKQYSSLSGSYAVKQYLQNQGL